MTECSDIVVFVSLSVCHDTRIRPLPGLDQLGISVLFYSTRPKPQCRNDWSLLCFTNTSPTKVKFIDHASILDTRWESADVHRGPDAVCAAICIRMSLWTTCFTHLKVRSWLVRLAERNHFQAALWRQKLHASCFIYSIFLTKNAYFMPNEAYQPKSPHFHEDSFEKTLSWTYCFKLLWPPCPPVTWPNVLHGRKVPHFTIKPINSRPAVVEHSSVTYIRTQLTTPQPRGQMLESSIEFDLVEH